MSKLHSSGGNYVRLCIRKFAPSDCGLRISCPVPGEARSSPSLSWRATVAVGTFYISTHHLDIYTSSTSRYLHIIYIYTHHLHLTARCKMWRCCQGPCSPPSCCCWPAPGGPPRTLSRRPRPPGCDPSPAAARSRHIRWKNLILF